MDRVPFQKGVALSEHLRIVPTDAKAWVLCSVTLGSPAFLSPLHIARVRAAEPILPQSTQLDFGEHYGALDGRFDRIIVGVLSQKVVSFRGRRTFLRRNVETACHPVCAGRRGCEGHPKSGLRLSDDHISYLRRQRGSPPAARLFAASSSANWWPDGMSDHRRDDAGLAHRRPQSARSRPAGVP